MKRAIGFAPFIFLVIVTGCATQNDVHTVQRDIDEFKSRFIRMEKEMGGLRVETREDTGKSISELQKTIDTIRSDQADLREGLDGVAVDMQVAAGSIEDLRLEALKSMEEINFLREEMDYRLSQHEEMFERVQKGFDELQAKSTPAPTQDNPVK